MHGKRAGMLTEAENKKEYLFEYDTGYGGPAISVTMPVSAGEFRFEHFPPFFEGLLPEGANLDMLLRTHKLDRDDLFGILLTVGSDTVGAVTIKEVQNEAMSDHI